MKTRSSAEERYRLSWPAIYAIVAGTLLLLIIAFGLFTAHFA